MRYATNCEEITIYSFYGILEKDDFRYIIIGWDGYEDLGVEFSEIVAKELWIKIYDEYCRLSQDNKTLLFFETACELVYLENRFTIASSLLGLLRKNRNNIDAMVLFADALARWKYKINLENDIDLEIEKVQRNLNGSENKIRLKKNELENLSGDENSEKLTLSRQLIKMEQALNRDEINPKTTSMMRFIDMLNEIKEITEARAKEYGSKL